MKKLLFAMAFALLCGLRLLAQESSVKILLNEEERFRFEDTRLKFINPGFHVMIGDSTGMNDTANAETVENTFIGHRAGSINQDSWNTFLGTRAGEYHNLGRNNTYLGAWAGRWDSTGQCNTYVGADAGESNKTGRNNTFIGWCAGSLNTSGRLNTFVGVTCGINNTSGIENAYFGTSAGGSNTTGSFNTCIGRRAGLLNQEGSGNTFLGYYAGANEMGSNKLYVANSDTDAPLIYGEFDTQMLRLNAHRMEMRNPEENIIIGDSSGLQTYGWQNVILGSKSGKNIINANRNTYIGYRAGYSDTSGFANVFIGMETGLQNTSGHRNTFVGTNAGYSNTTGLRNTFIGLTAGGANTTGSYNTYLGRIAGYNNQEGDSNVFIGNAAGQNEMGSSKLYIDNSGRTDPLIYGDFTQKKLKFNADSVQTTGEFLASGEVRTGQRFNTAGHPGITDTINTVTSVDFVLNKVKYRTTVYTGGIATFMSLETDWVDEVGEYIVPCGEISVIGEFSEWQDDHIMTRNVHNPDLWTTTIRFTVADDCFPGECDSIIEVKFREDVKWDANWGSTDFPAGTGIQGGPNIPVPLDKYQDTTLYYIHFNCRTGEYSFEDLTGFCGDSITDVRDNKKYATILIGDQCWMAQDLNVGTRIDGGIDQAENTLIEKYCYNNSEDSCSKWGGLYQWPELMQYTTTPGTRGICPAGWHIPTDEEFKVLEGNVDSQYGPGSTEWNKIVWRGFDAGLNLRATEGWNGSGNGTDAFGFHALPGGYMIDYNVFSDGGSCNQYYTSSSNVYSTPYIRHLNGGFNQVTRNTNTPDDACSLRCLKDF